MARTWESRRLANERAVNEQLKSDMLNLAARVGGVVLRFATATDDGGQRIVPNRRTTRETVRLTVWNDVLKPYFIGAGTEPLLGAEPQSDYMRLIVNGVRGAVEIQAERQVQVIEKHASDPVRQWLTGIRPLRLQQMQRNRRRTQRHKQLMQFSKQRRTVREQGGGRPLHTPWYDPYHLFVNPDGYRLSDAGWRTSREVRNQIDALLDHHIARGTAAVDIADLLEQHLWPRAKRVRTRTPYGTDGSYWARRLARTEVTAASGRSLVNAALASPYVSSVKWNLSRSHPCCDNCDDLAAGGPEGDGVYPKTDVPRYPAHPHCLCYLIQVVTSQPANLSAFLEEQIRLETPEIVALRGAFNLNWLVNALLYGWLVDQIFEDDSVNNDVLFAPLGERAAA